MDEMAKLLQKGNMMQLEEVNRATSPEEYLKKLEQWATDRGMPGMNEPFQFTVVMQYCERLEAVWQAFAGIDAELVRLRDTNAQQVRELKCIKVQAEKLLNQPAGGWLTRLLRWWSPGRPSGQPGGGD